jgi:hypothetical protein
MHEEPEPLKILGVITEEVGSPSNDGSAGSALYRVPIRLSRRPEFDEATLLVATWDRPPQWTTMHRPGIAYVDGYRFVLDGTTVEEVRDYHAATLKLVVDQVNRQAYELRRRKRAEAERAQEAEQAHRTNVQHIAGAIKFE